jgi:hypothetical protein
MATMVGMTQIKKLLLYSIHGKEPETMCIICQQWQITLCLCYGANIVIIMNDKRSDKVNSGMTKYHLPLNYVVYYDTQNKNNNAHTK